MAKLKAQEIDVKFNKCGKYKEEEEKGKRMMGSGRRERVERE